MKYRREDLIASALSQLNLADNRLERELTEECPWLDGREELDEELAVDMLADVFATYDLDRERCGSFVRAYNKSIRQLATDEPHRSETYDGIRRILGRIGVEGVAPEADWWLVEDSFSTDTIVVIVFSRLDRLDEARDEIGRLIDGSPCFVGVDFNLQDGTNALRISNRANPA